MEPSTDNQTDPRSNVGPATINLHIPAQPSRQPQRSAWAELLNSTVVVAVVTAMLGGYFANIAVQKFQEAARRREQDLAAYRQHIEKQQDVILRGYDLLADAVADADAIIDLTSRHMDLRNTLPDQRDALAKQRRDILARHNLVTETWSKENLKLGSLMAYYHPGVADVHAAWEKCCRAVDEFRACANEHYLQYRNDPRVTSDSKPVCPAHRAKVDGSLQELARVLNSARRYAWMTDSLPNR